MKTKNIQVQEPEKNPLIWKLKLTPEQKKEIAELIEKHVIQIEKERKETEKTFGCITTQWQEADDYYHYVVEDTDFPFEGCSNMPGIIIPMSVDSGRANIMKALELNPPYIISGETDSDKKIKQELWLQNAVRNDVKGFKTDMASILTSAFLKGTGVQRLGLKKEQYSYIEFEKFFGKEDLKDFKSKYSDLSEREKTKYIQMLKNDEVVVIASRVTKQYWVKEAPWIPNDKFLIHKDAKDPADEDFVGEIISYTPAELKEKKVSGEFEGVDEVFEKSGIKDDDSSDETFEVISCVLKKDLDGDGYQEKNVFVMERKTKTILQSSYYLWPDNKSYYINYHIQPWCGRFFRQGFYHKLKATHEENKELHDLVINSGYITLVPSFKARTGNDFDPTRQKWYPGVVWWLERLDDVVQFEVRPSQLNFAGYEQLSLAYSREISGLSPYYSGTGQFGQRESGEKIKTLLSAGGVRLNEYLLHLNEGLTKLAEGLLFLGKLELQSGIKEIRGQKIKADDLEISPDVTYVAPLSSDALNPEAVFEKNARISDYLLSKPVIAENPFAVREILHEFIVSARGVWTEKVNKLIPTEEELKELAKQAQRERKRLSPEIPGVIR